MLQIKSSRFFFFAAWPKSKNQLLVLYRTKTTFLFHEGRMSHSVKGESRLILSGWVLLNATFLLPPLSLSLFLFGHCKCINSLLFDIWSLSLDWLERVVKPSLWSIALFSLKEKLVCFYSARVASRNRLFLFTLAIMLLHNAWCFRFRLQLETLLSPSRLSCRWPNQPGAASLFPRWLARVYLSIFRSQLTCTEKQKTIIELKSSCNAASSRVCTRIISQIEARLRFVRCSRLLALRLEID